MQAREACLQLPTKVTISTATVISKPAPESYATFGSPLLLQSSCSNKSVWRKFASIDDVRTRSVYAGNPEEGGKLVEFNGLYSNRAG